MQALRVVAFASVATFVVLSTTPGRAAPLTLNELQGAWISGSAACESVFTGAKTGPRFKKPVDVFAAAFIVSGKKLSTPGASCRIGSIKSDGELTRAKLMCTNQIANQGVEALFSLDADGKLRRHINETDQNGSIYTRCN